MTDNREKLLSILKAEVETFDSSKCSNGSTSFSDLGLDSLDVFAFMSAVEGEFNIKIEDDDLAKLTSLDLLDSYINTIKNQ